MRTVSEQIEGDAKELRDIAQYFDSCGKKSNGDFLREIAVKIEICETARMAVLCFGSEAEGQAINDLGKAIADAF